jgi:hypothetical protein
MIVRSTIFTSVASARLFKGDYNGSDHGLAFEQLETVSRLHTILVFAVSRLS